MCASSSVAIPDPAEVHHREDLSTIAPVSPTVASPAPRSNDRVVVPGGLLCDASRNSNMAYHDVVRLRLCNNTRAHAAGDNPLDGAKKADRYMS